MGLTRLCWSRSIDMGRMTYAAGGAPVWGPLLLAAAAVLSCLGYATGAVNVTRSEFTGPLTVPARGAVGARGPVPADLTAGETAAPARAISSRPATPPPQPLTLKAGDGLI